MMIHKTTFSGVKEKNVKALYNLEYKHFNSITSKMFIVITSNCKLLCFIKEMKFIKFIYPFSRTYISEISIENGQGHMVLFYKGSA